MDRYEYKEISIRPQNDYLLMLNELGNDGWEAVHFYIIGQVNTILLKRKITT